MMEGPPQVGKQPLESKDVMKKEALVEIDRFIEKEVDVKALRSIYEERYREAGLDPALLNFPLGDSKNRVFQTNKEVAHMGGMTLGEDASGYYIPVVKKISIDIETPKIDPNDKTPQKLKDLRNNVHDKIETLHHLIHESTHAASDWGKGIENGFSRSFRALNEAVTERLAQEVTLQHIRKTNFAGGLDAWRPVSDDVKSYAHLAKKGDPKEQAQKIFFDKDFGAYSEERRILQKIIDAVSAETKQSPEEVWRDLANSYLRKEKFDTPERRALLEKVFHPGFVEKLGQVNTNDEETTKNLFNKDTPPKKNTIIDRWLNVYKRK